MKNIPMNINFNINNSLRFFIPFVYILLFSYVFNFILFIYLAKEGVDFLENNNKNFEIKNYDYYKNKAKSNKLIYNSVETKNLNKYVLTAIYSTKTGGVISLIDKNKQSFILSKNEKIDGFTLKTIYPDYVLFEKESTIFKIKMNDKEEMKSYKIENSFILKRGTLNSFIKNPQNLIKEITIDENIFKNKIDGFKITNIEKKSIFSKLGLEKGDVIKKLNNNYLSSYQDVMKIYNKIDELKFLKIEILRGKKVMELNYEIN